MLIAVLFSACDSGGSRDEAGRAGEATQQEKEAFEHSQTQRPAEEAPREYSQSRGSPLRNGELKAALELEGGDAAGTGREPIVWRTRLSHPVAAGAVIGDGRVYVLDESGGVNALSVDSGSLRYRVALPEPSVIAPAYRDGTLYVAGITGTLYAVDTESAAIRGSRHVADSTPLGVAVTERRLYTVFADGSVAALERATLSVAWRYELDALPAGPVAVSDGALYVAGQNGEFAALDAADGEEIYRRSLAETFVDGPVIADRSALLPLVSGGAAVIALEDGSVVGSIGGAVTSIAVSGNYRYLAGATLSVRQGGTEIWSYGGIGGNTLPAVALEESVLVLSDSGELVALEGASGNALFQLSLGARSVGEPLPVIEQESVSLVVVALRSGALVAVRPSAAAAAEPAAERLLSSANGRVGGTLQAEGDEIAVFVQRSGTYEFSFPLQEQAPVVASLENERGAAVAGNLDKAGLENSFTSRLEGGATYTLVVQALREELNGKRYVVELKRLTAD